MPVDLLFKLPHGEERSLSIDHLTIAGWTGRDIAAVEHHIEELAAIGVSRPSSVPLFYRAGAGLLTQAPVIDVLGDETSGEVEPLLLADAGEMFLGIGSDHTDRALEASSVAASKQACPKPVARAVWPLAELQDHLDDLELRAWIRDDVEDGWTLYQEGTLAAIRPLADLVRAAPNATSDGRLADGSAMMCGTLAARGGVRPARHFRMALHDPVLGRTLEHEYCARPLPVIA